MKKRQFDVVIERDEKGWFIVDVPALPGCHSQGKTKEDALKNIAEAIELYLESADFNQKGNGFVGIEKVVIDA